MDIDFLKYQYCEKVKLWDIYNSTYVLQAIKLKEIELAAAGFKIEYTV